MLGHLSERTARLFVLTDTVTPAQRAAAARWPRLSLIPLGAARFPQRSAAWLQDQLEGPGLDIAHDLLGHLAPFFEAHAGRGTRFINTQLTSNWAWFERVRRAGPSFDARYAAQRVLSLWKDRRVSARVDRSWVLGPGHERDLIEAHGMSPARIFWAPAETDTDYFCPSGPPRPISASPHLLFTGAVWRNKGVDLLLDVAESLLADWPTLRLSLVGPSLPWEQAWLTRQRLRRPIGAHLDMPGRLDQAALRARYREADLYVFPSLFEGSPRTVREALACGCPVVASELPGHRGIDPHGDFIRFEPIGDRARWRAAIVAALTEPLEARAARVARGRAHLVAHHHPSAVAARLYAVYLDLVQT